jgi:hypothetical protein
MLQFSKGFPEPQAITACLLESVDSFEVVY